MPQPDKAVSHMLPLYAPSSTSQSSDWSGAIVSLLQNDIAQSSMLRMSECSSSSWTRFCSEAGLQSSANSSSGVHRPLSVAPHELAEQYWARGDALDFDNAVVAAAAASR